MTTVDDLDMLLDRSTPELSEPPGTGLAVTELVAASRRTATRRRPRRRTAGVVVSSVLLVAGGTTAAAAKAGGWSLPWADDPLTSISYTLPSGRTCEQRIGDLRVADPRAQRIVQRWLARSPLMEILDVDAAIADLREGESTYDPGDGSQIPVGYGTPRYDADYEYAAALSNAAMTAVGERLAAEGFAEHVDVTWEGETHCSGPGEPPGLPWWVR